MSGRNNDMRTPLAKVRGLGSAREGTDAFLAPAPDGASPTFR